MRSWAGQPSPSGERTAPRLPTFVLGSPQTLFSSPQLRWQLVAAFVRPKARVVFLVGVPRRSQQFLDFGDQALFFLLHALVAHRDGIGSLSGFEFKKEPNGKNSYAVVLRKKDGAQVEFRRDGRYIRIEGAKSERRP